MNQAKGMSQTLALIVAASVLMMTALTVIFLAQGSLGDFGQDSDVNSCTQAVRAQCQTALTASGSSNQATIDTPSNCIDGDGNVIDELGNMDIVAKVSSPDGETITCQPTS